MTNDKPGPTGEFPDGKLNADDAGALSISVGHDYKGNVVIEFGARVSWIAMPPSDARAFAAFIIDHAEQAEARLRPRQ